MGPELEFNGYRISVFPDFSAATQRASFQQVKKCLQRFESGGYPAKLCIVANGKVYFFTTPVDASKWLDAWGHPRGGKSQHPP